MKIHEGEKTKFSHVCKIEFDDYFLFYCCCFDGIGEGFCEATFVPHETPSLDTKFCCCVVPGLWTLVIQLSLSASLIKCPLSPSACYTFASNNFDL